MTPSPHTPADARSGTGADATPTSLASVGSSRPDLAAALGDLRLCPPPRPATGTPALPPMGGGGAAARHARASLLVDRPPPAPSAGWRGGGVRAGHETAPPPDQENVPPAARFPSYAQPAGAIPLALAAPAAPPVVPGLPPAPGHPLSCAPTREAKLPTPPRPVRAAGVDGASWRRAEGGVGGDTSSEDEQVKAAGDDCHAGPPPPTKYVPPPRRARAALAELAAVPPPRGAPATVHLDAVATWCHNAAARGRGDAAAVVADTTARALLDRQLAAASSGAVQRAPWYRDKPRTRYPGLPGRASTGAGGPPTPRDVVAMQPAAARPVARVPASGKAHVVGAAPFIPDPDTQASPDAPPARARRVPPPPPGSAAAAAWGAWPATGF